MGLINNILFSIISQLMLLFTSAETTYETDAITTKNLFVETTATKEKAFTILRNKCYLCHKKRNKNHVLTAKKMDTRSQDVHKQVSVKKRMLKCKKTKLTEADKQKISTWVSYINI